MKAIKIQGKRPKTAFQRLSEESSDDGYKTVSTAYVSINKNNARGTFKTLQELDDFLKTIEWEARGLDDFSTEFVEGINDSNTQLEHFKDIVDLALSIRDSGQLQPVTVVNEEGRYRTVSGSTRVMACHILGIGVEIKVITPKDEIEEYKAHLSENLKRKNLSFTETANGYKILFEILISKGQIKEISRKNIMLELGVSRAYAGMWNKVLTTVMSDKSFHDQLLNDDFSSLKAAYTHLRNSEEPQSKSTPVSHLESEPSNTPETPVEAEKPNENGVQIKNSEELHTESEMEQPENFQLEHWSEKKPAKLQEAHIIEIKANDADFLERMVSSIFDGEAKHLERSGKDHEAEKLQALLLKSLPIKNAKTVQAALDSLNAFIESL